jgi:acyl dehydratase
LHLSDVFAVRSDRAVLELSATIFDEAGATCTKHLEHFMVTHLKKNQLELLKEKPLGKHHKDTCLIKPTTYKRRLKGKVTPLEISPNMGVDYGKISGDLNIVHTTHLAARLMGYPKAFIQGFCTVNLLLGQLAGAMNLSLKELHCTFARPIFVGETVYFSHEHDRFELVNNRGKVVAYGLSLEDCSYQMF